MNIVDGCGGSYKVALNSALEFGVMFNPNKNREEALVRMNLLSNHPICMFITAPTALICVEFYGLSI